MKNVNFLLLLFSVMLSAQNNRMIYEYHFRPDSTKMDSLKTEWMYLDISEKGSKYYSKNAFESDSIVRESIKKQMASGSRNVQLSRQRSGGEVSYEIEKVYPSFETFLTTSIDHDWFKVKDERKLQWQVGTEKKKIGEFEAQKATTKFAGRTWTAWFTTEVPVQDGPYKFSGLPGLIVAVEDATGSHKMELKGIKKLTAKAEEDLNLQGKEIPMLRKKPLEVTRDQYQKRLKQYRNDPVQGMREMLSRPNSTVKINIGGKEISDSKEILRVMEENLKQQMAQNNNHIELN